MTALQTKRDSVCEACPFNENPTISWRPQHKDASVLLVFDEPTHLEITANSPFSSAAVQTVRSIIKARKLDTSAMEYVYSTPCFLPGKQDGEKSLKYCRKLVGNLLDAYPKATHIITLGTRATKWLLGNVALTGVLNQPQKLQHGERTLIVIPTWNPSYAAYRVDALDELDEVFDTLAIVQGRAEALAYPTIQEIQSDEDMREALQILATAPHVGYDIETGGEGWKMGLKLFHPDCKVLTAAFATPEHAFWIPGDRKEWIRALLKVCGKKLVAHNAPFDMKGTLLKYGNMELLYDDTLILSYLENENRRHGLKVLSSKYLGWYNYDEGMKTKRGELEAENIQDVGQYNALDAAATVNLYTILWDLLDEQDKELYKLLIELQRMFTEITMNGVLTDILHVGTLKSELEDQRAAALKKIQEDPLAIKARRIITEVTAAGAWATFMKGELMCAPDDSTEPADTLSLTNARHLLALCVAAGKIPEGRTETGQVATDKEALSSMGDIPVFQQIMEVKRVDKLISAFVTGLLKWVYPDGKIHPVYSLTGTATGRTSCNDPNYQQWPRDPRFRDMFYVPEGYKLIHYDFKNAEVYVAASLSGDEDLIKALRSGEDLHKTVGSMVFGKPVSEITTEERTYAKRTTFGVIYQIGPAGLAGQIHASEAAAKDIMKRYMDRFPGLNQWIQKMKRLVSDKGVVTTPFGRKRRLPQVWSSERGIANAALRQAINSPIQATASDINLLLLHYLYRHLDKDKAWLLSSIHDAGEIMVKEDYVQETHDMIQRGLEVLNRKLTFIRVPLVVDVEIGQRAGTLEKMEAYLERVKPCL